MRCLVVQTAFLGDVILTVPLLGLLERDPRVSRTFVIAAPPGAGFLEGQGAADRVIAYDKRGRDAGHAGMMRVVRELRELSIDVALVPHRSFRSAFVPLAARVPRRIGFTVSGGRSMLTERVPYRADAHEIERVAALARPLGIDLPGGRLPFELKVPDGQDEALAATLSERGAGGRRLRLVVAPGSRWATKRWLPSRFAQAAGSLAGELSADVAVVGAEEEADVGAMVSAEAGPSAVDLTGTLPLGQLLALVSGASLVLSNDSAVTHIAAGLGVPVVTVFGPTVPAQGFAPYTDRARIVETELPCRPCGRHGSDRCPVGTLGCMELVTVEDVVSAGLDLVGEERPGA
ncbi:MAG: glycosyltransferase family 9 protein [Candidatus Eisenbacteria bacterium]